MNEDGRSRLKRDWGPEVLLKCCRYWKTHGWQWGYCGICRERPEMVKGGKWEDADV